MIGAAVWRVAVPAGGAALLGVFVFFYLDHPTFYAAVLTGWGVVPFRFPFLDAHAVLSAVECAGRGLDPYLYNPCDVLSRAHVYSPLFLEADIFPVTVAWTNVVGITLALALVLCLASLPPPRGGREWTVMVLAALSTMTIFAIERGNNDLLVFVLMTLACHSAQRGAAGRATAHALILFGACLKYYPIVALVTALREPPRRFIAIAVTSVAIVALFIIHYHRGLAEGMALVPSGSYFTDLFGAMNLPFGLARLLSPLGIAMPVSRPFLATLPWLVLLLLIVSGARQAIAGLAEGAAVARLGAAELLFLVSGAALILGCFFSGQSIGYRGIFFLLLLPGLLARARDPADGRRFFSAAALIVFLMWGELFREALRHLSFANPAAMLALQIVRIVFWMLRELVWWRVIAILAELLLGFAATSAIGMAVLGRMIQARETVQ